MTISDPQTSSTSTEIEPPAAAEYLKRAARALYAAQRLTFPEKAQELYLIRLRINALRFEIPRFGLHQGRANP